MPFSRFQKKSFKKTQSTLTTSREPFFFVECFVASQDLTFTMVVLVSTGQGAWKFPPKQNWRLGSPKKCFKLEARVRKIALRLFFMVGPRYMIRQMDIFSMVKSAGKATDSISILNLWFPRHQNTSWKGVSGICFLGSKCLLTRCLDV